jgi:Zn-dependent protease with chaperone function
MHSINTSPVVYRGGWTLLHSVWELAAVAGIFSLVLLLLGGTSPRIRYLAASMTLAVMFVLPFVTFRIIGVASLPLSKPSLGSRVTSGIADLSNKGKKTGDYSVQPADPSALRHLSFLLPTLPAGRSTSSPVHRLAEWVRPAMPWAMLLWFIGALTLSVWHLGGWIAIQRMRSLGVISVSPELVNLLSNLAAELGLKRSVSIARSTLVRVPVVIGFIRPLILIPASILAGLPAEYLEAVIAHELAHIRRHDYLVNLLQALIETILFYHPAVWWVSRKIREEREHCCDDIAAGLCGDRRLYAKALLSVEELCPPVSLLAVAVTGGGGQMFNRVKRLTDVPRRPRFRRSASLAAVFLSLNLLLLPLLPERIFGQGVSTTGQTARNAPLVRVQVTDAAGKMVPIYEILVIDVLVNPGQLWTGCYNRQFQGGDNIQEHGIDGSALINAKQLETPESENRFAILFKSDSSSETLEAVGDCRSDPTTIKAVLAPSDIEFQGGPIVVAQDEFAGRVIDPYGKPVAGALVSFPESHGHGDPLGHPAITDKDGVFRFPHAGDASYVYLKIEKEGFAPRWIVDLELGKGFAVRLDNTTRMAGTVVLPDGNPGTGANITIQKSKISHRTNMGPLNHLQMDLAADARGHFDVPLEPGEYELLAQGPRGLFSRIAGVHLQAHKVLEQRITLLAGVHLKVRATEIVTGNPVVGAKFIIVKPIQPFMDSWDDPGSERVTDEKGIAEWFSLMPGFHGIAVRAAGYERWRTGSDIREKGFGIDYVQLDLEPDMPVVAIQMEPGMHLAGKIIYPNGNPPFKVFVGVPDLHTGDYRYTRPVNDKGDFDLTIPVTLGDDAIKTLSLAVFTDRNNSILLGRSEKFIPQAGGSKYLTVAIGRVVELRESAVDLIKDAGKQVAELERDGKKQEALEALLECYRQVRSSDDCQLLMGSFVSLGRSFPPALTALRELRDTATHEFRANLSDIKIGAEVALLNQRLGDGKRTIALYDSIQTTSTLRREFAAIAHDTFVQERRYSDVLIGRSYGSMLNALEMGQRTAQTFPDERSRANFREFIVQQTASDIEVLIGAGKIDEAKILRGKLLAFDGSEATRSVVEIHLERAKQSDQ